MRYTDHYYPWACGDTCITNFDRCFCGATHIAYGGASHSDWCCTSGPCEVTEVRFRVKRRRRKKIKKLRFKNKIRKIVKCPGSIKRLGSVCNETCSNIGDDLWLIPQATGLCGKDKCIKGSNLCAGKQLCEDDTDLMQCTNSLLQNKTCTQNIQELGWNWNCGDTCISGKSDKCLCGGVEVSNDSPDWCCNTAPCEVISIGPRGQSKNVMCPGTVQSLGTSCNGSCNQATQ